MIKPRLHIGYEVTRATLGIHLSTKAFTGIVAVMVAVEVTVGRGST